MGPSRPVGCPLHGNGVDPTGLVGRRIKQVVASWHVFGGAPDGPLDVWLIDDDGACTHITAGSDWCLIVEASQPSESYDMAEYGRIEARPVNEETPLAGHVGERVIAVREQVEPRTGRTGLDLVFASGTVHCDSGTGDLLLTS
jgi:hypothetical protein